jgi:hypothetical protein
MLVFFDFSWKRQGLAKKGRWSGADGSAGGGRDVIFYDFLFGGNLVSSGRL